MSRHRVLPTIPALLSLLLFLCCCCQAAWGGGTAARSLARRAVCQGPIPHNPDALPSDGETFTVPFPLDGETTTLRITVEVWGGDEVILHVRDDAGRIAPLDLRPNYDLLLPGERGGYLLACQADDDPEPELIPFGSMGCDLDGFYDYDRTAGAFVLRPRSELPPWLR